MDRKYRHQVKSPDGSWFGLNEKNGTWEKLTKGTKTNNTQLPIINSYSDLNEKPLALPIVTNSHYRERAESFVLKTTWFSGITALMILIVSVVFFKVPFLSLTLLFFVWLGFTVSWLIGFMWHELTSTEGILFYHTMKQWQYINKEQSERHSHYRERWQVVVTEENDD